MLLVSQNLRNYEMDFPPDTVMRINLAWVPSLKDLEERLETLDYEVFLDIPTGRMKPPNNQYKLDDLKQVLDSHPNARYIAVSNVEDGEVIEYHRGILGENITIVPKIETMKGVGNLSGIFPSLIGEKVIMLDHDDLFTDVVSKGGNSQTFLDQVDILVRFCKENDIILLRAKGVIFSDDI